MWRYAYPFSMVNNALFYTSERYFVLPTDGQTAVPISEMEATDTEVTVYKNGQITPGFTVADGSLTINAPLKSRDILMIECKTSSGGGSGGGCIPDVPNDNKDYVRKYGAWKDVMTETWDEGTF